MPASSSSPARSRAPRAPRRPSPRWPGSRRAGARAGRAGCEDLRAGGMLARPLRAREVRMATGSSGGSVVAALVLGAAIVVGALVVKSAIDEQTVVLADVQATLADLQDAVAGGGLRGAAAVQPRRPDPSQRVEIPRGGAAVRGPENAKVSIVEYSDFQCPS